MPNARGVAHFAERLGLDLADSFASDFELLADLFQSSGITVAKAEAKFEDLAFAFGKAAKDISQLILEQAVAGHVGWILSGFIFDEIAEVRVFAVANGRLQ